jgi:hypothetical protein
MDLFMRAVEEMPDELGYEMRDVAHYGMGQLRQMVPVLLASWQDCEPYPNPITDYIDIGIAVEQLHPDDMDFLVWSVDTKTTPVVKAAAEPRLKAVYRRLQDTLGGPHPNRSYSR